MPKTIRLLAAIAIGGFGVAACATTHATPPTSSSATSPSPCVGLSICPPAPPDAEGNPACFYSDGWQATSSGTGIEVWYFHEPQNMSRAEKVTAIVRKKDGTTESQDANIDAGQQVHRFEFPAVDKSSVSEVLFDANGSRCFVVGPGG